MKFEGYLHRLSDDVCKDVHICEHPLVLLAQQSEVSLEYAVNAGQHLIHSVRAGARVEHELWANACVATTTHVCCIAR